MKTGKDSVKRTFAKDRRFKKAARTSDYLRTHWCVWWLAVGILQRRSEGNWSGVHPDILLPLAPPKKKLKENDGIHNPLVITHDHRFPNAHKPSTQHRLVAPCSLNTFEAALQVADGQCFFRPRATTRSKLRFTAPPFATQATGDTTSGS